MHFFQFPADACVRSLPAITLAALSDLVCLAGRKVPACLLQKFKTQHGVKRCFFGEFCRDRCMGSPNLSQYTPATRSGILLLYLHFLQQGNTLEGQRVRNDTL